MSGHSKWHNIQNKIGKELALAIKNSGANPDTNAKLRDVIAKAKAANMPNDNINRAIKKAEGELDSVNYEKIVYEGYGPSGVAVIVETLTDNKNRSAGNVRSAFTKGGGNMGTTGCVGFMFQEKGEIVKEDRDEDEMMMLALDAGAEDFAAEEEVFVVTTTPEDFGTVREALEAEEIEFLEAAVKMVPDTYTAINEDDAKKFQKMLDLLDDDDDVTDVYHNAEFPEGWEE